MAKNHSTNEVSNPSASTITPPVRSLVTATAARLRAIVAAELQESGDGGEVRRPIAPKRDQNIHRREQR